MARVKSLEQQVQEIIRDRNLGKSAKLDGKRLDDILILEANRLKELLAKYIRAYYDSYTPKSRGLKTSRFVKYHMARALRVDANVKDRSISIWFDDSVWGPSVIDEEKWGWGFEPILIDTGWRVNPSAPHANIYRFGYFEGFHFIRKAIEEFEKTNKYGLYVSVKAATKVDSEFGEKYKLSSIAKDTYDRMGIY